ncbi:uncharacterized mitochondrial protein AtMg00810-like [Pyrus communis]|uniref:uncharacterized mitochondrial protein AtMg00810-like n=1 Tax=Pyrus communis TaxID=23211 RepID=UPI0035BED219
MTRWQHVMQEEYDALKAQGTWKLVPLPPNREVIGSKWVYKIKRNSNGTISRYKARLVAQGFSQNEGLDYYETFSLVVRHTTVRIILALAAQSSSNSSLFVKIDDGDVILLILLTYFLGLQIQYNYDRSLLVTQLKYAKELLKKAGMENYKPTSTPSKPHSQLLVAEGNPLVDPTHYRSLVGALQYLTFTHPDTAHSVNLVCQYMTNPTDLHMHLVKRIIRYLQGTLECDLKYTMTQDFNIAAFSDSDWAADINTRRSITGFVVFLGSNPVSWQSKKQAIVS